MRLLKYLSYLALPLTLSSLSLFSLPAMAQNLTARSLAEIQSSDSKQTSEGWTPKLRISANANLMSSHRFIGQTDGDSTTLGLNLDGSLAYQKNRHTWRGLLHISEATTKTPTLSQFIKSSDEFKLESIYLYSSSQYPWLGPYLKGNLQTPLFKGEDIRPDSSTYVITDRHGSMRTFESSSLRLTDPFRPLSTRESGGLFMNLITEPRSKLQLRMGLGALQVNAKGQLAIQKKAGTSDIHVIELKSYEQAGLELGLSFEGQWDDRSSYSVGVESLTPFINDLEEGDTRDAWSLTEYDSFARLSTKVYEWLSLNYEFKLRKQPQLLEQTQTQHMVLANFVYDVF